MQDLQDYFWHEQAQVVCNYFGTYLFIHLRSQLPAFVERVAINADPSQVDDTIDRFCNLRGMSTAASAGAAVN
jgi:hypothetical protein